jgi:hypothetical protein
MSILAKINCPENSLAKSEIAYSVLIHGSDQIPINSISEDEFTIDVSNYSKNHLRDFETQIKDIRIFFV